MPATPFNEPGASCARGAPGREGGPKLCHIAHFPPTASNDEFEECFLRAGLRIKATLSPARKCVDAASLRCYANPPYESLWYRVPGIRIHTQVTLSGTAHSSMHRSGNHTHWSSSPNPVHP